MGRAAGTASSDLQKDLQMLRDDFGRLAQQVADIVANRGSAAWERARAILDRVLVSHGGAPAPKRQNIGSQRLLQAAAEAEVHDTCLWTPLAVATGAQGNLTALVGTPEAVAKALLEYYKLGATSLLIRGYDPRPDAVQYGEELIPLIRKLVADYDAANSTGDRGRPGFAATNPIDRREIARDG